MKKIIYTIAALTLMSGVAVAQDEVKKDSLSLLTERVEKNEGAVSKFSKLKFSAYVQAQAEFAQEDGTTKQYIKSELLPEVKGSNGIEVLQTLSKTNISLLVDTNTFSFGETNELQINKIDGGVF